MDDTAFMTRQVQDIYNALNEMLNRWTGHDLPSDFLPIGAYPFDLSLEDIQAEVGASLEFLQDDHALPFMRQNTELAKDLTRRDALDHVLPSTQYHSGGLRVMMRDLDGGWLVKLHDNWGDPEDGTIVVHRYHPEHPTEGTEAFHADETVTYFIDGQDALKRWLETEAPRPMKWFINEEGEVYPYDPKLQPEVYPNDDHVAYDTEEDAVQAQPDTGTPVPEQPAQTERKVPTLTIGEFRRLTADLSDDEPITIDAQGLPPTIENHAWFNVELLPETVEALANEDRAPSLQLNLLDTFDMWQF